MTVRTIALLAAVLLAGCALGATPRQAAEFDLGPWNGGGDRVQLDAPVQVVDVLAPPWLDRTGISYRLAFRDPFRREVYRDSQWVAPPALLLAERLRTRFSSAPAAPRAVTQEERPATPHGANALHLAIDVEEFSQVFASPTQSTVSIRLRARLSGSEPGAPTRERRFEIERTAPSADARGAVVALSGGVDALIEQIAVWAARP